MKDPAPLLPGLPAPAAELWREHTGEGWKAADPEGYAQCVELIKGGELNRSRLARRFGKSRQTIAGLLAQEFTVEQLEAIIAKKALLVAAESLERQGEVIHEAGARELGALAMVSKGALETSKQARGQSLHLHEHVHVHVDAATAAERLRQKAAKMDLEAGKAGALPAGALAPGALAPLAAAPVDIQSTGGRSQIIDLEPLPLSRDTFGDTAADPGAENSQRGGGGRARPREQDA